MKYKDKPFVVIQISGKQGSGKTTLSTKLRDTLFTKYGWWYFMYRYADPLYDSHDAVRGRFAQTYGIPMEEEKDGNLLQAIGDWARSKDPDILVNAAMNRIASQVQVMAQAKEPRFGCVIIDDLRMEPEFHAFEHAITLRLECPEETRRIRADYWRRGTTHITEIALDGYAAKGKFDIVIDTDTNQIEDVLNIAVDFIWRTVSGT